MIAATVTQVTPLRVRVDGAASDSPAVLAGGTTPAMSARVYVFPNTSPLLVQAGVSFAGYATTAALNAETSRATSAEASLSSAITAETTRAQAAEAAISSGAVPFASLVKLGL